MSPLRFFYHPPDKGGSERFLRAGGWFSGRENQPPARLTAHGPLLRGPESAAHGPLVRGPETR